MLKISKNSIDDRPYKDKLNTVKALQTPKAGRLIFYWLLGILAISIIVLFLPWRQNISANGGVTAFAPEDRPQTVETAIAGRIKEWKVREGVFVKQGDTLLLLSEIKEKYFDPEMLLRMREQLAAKEGSIAAKNAKIDALGNQIEALQMGLKLKLEQLEQKVLQKRLKVQSDSMALEAAKVDAQIYQRQLEGAEGMYKAGVVPLVKLEESRSKQQKAQATLTEYQNKLDAARNDLIISLLDLSTTKAENAEKVAKAQSDRSATIADLQDSMSEYAKAKNEYVNMSIRSEQYALVAPQDGYVVKALKAGIGETVKEGEALVTIMPDKPLKAIELYVKAMDIALLDTGRHVRLQFDGWPALQFSGWPSVAVGTFGGKVRVIDYVNSKPGKYRILVTPDSQEGDAEWPEKLRLGSAVYGWVMLDEVPVWFEIWRQLNGFPPTVEAYEEEQKESYEKKGKKDEEEQVYRKNGPKPK